MDVGLVIVRLVFGLLMALGLLGPVGPALMLSSMMPALGITGGVASLAIRRRGAGAA